MHRHRHDEPARTAREKRGGGAGRRRGAHMGKKVGSTAEPTFPEKYALTGSNENGGAGASGMAAGGSAGHGISFREAKYGK